MVTEEIPAEELAYRALERAMKESQIHESTRNKVREFMRDPEIVDLFNLVKGALEKSPHWSEVEYTFFETVADVAGEEVKKKLKADTRFLKRSASRMVRVVSAVFWGLAALWLGSILDQGKASS